MSTPEGFKDLYKNVVWKNQDEKRAFFNHYFKKSMFTDELTKPLHREIDSLHDQVKELEKKLEGK